MRPEENEGSEDDEQGMEGREENSLDLVEDEVNSQFDKGDEDEEG